MAFNSLKSPRATQNATAYIVYMIIGSYFNEETCRNPLTVDTLFLYYKDMGPRKQESKEWRIIDQANKALMHYRKTLSEMNCECVFRYRDDMYVLDFLTGFERVHAEVDMLGHCEIAVLEA